jgi:beta-1,4-mannooligosaccharide/beta-1,4-mannosyl-N-acetylglucosamine phosphorylase
MIFKRHTHSPFLSRDSIPNHYPRFSDLSSVFNPGALRVNGQDLLMLRLQNRARETALLVARRSDCGSLTYAESLVSFRGLEMLPTAPYHVYDPRLSTLEGVHYIMMAMDFDSGCRLGLASTLDFEHFDFLGLVSEDDNRNGVLFPEKIQGRYARLDRPNQKQVQDGPLSGSMMHLSYSDDLLHWDRSHCIAKGRPHYWDELIGAGPPPVKTKQGWLLIYHGVALHYQPIYQVGVMLLDLANPAKVLARGRCNVLEPRELYECVGQVPNVVFPSGLVVDEFDADGFALPTTSLRLYYGAADTCVGLAEAVLSDLLKACTAP